MSTHRYCVVDPDGHVVLSPGKRVDASDAPRLSAPMAWRTAVSVVIAEAESVVLRIVDTDEFRRAGVAFVVPVLCVERNGPAYSTQVRAWHPVFPWIEWRGDGQDRERR